MDGYGSWLIVTRCGCQVPFRSREEAQRMARWHLRVCPQASCGVVVYATVAVAGVVAGGPPADVEVLA